MKENKNEKTQKTHKVDNATRESLKAEHKQKLRSLLLPLDDYNIEYLEVLAVIPSRKVISQAMRFMRSDPEKGQSILVKNCLLTSKERVIKEDELFFAAAGLLTELMPIREGKLGKV